MPKIMRWKPALERERAWENGQHLAERYETGEVYGSRLREDAEWEDEPIIREKAKRR